MYIICDLVICIYFGVPRPQGSGEQSSFRKAVGFFLTELATQDLSAAESCFTLGQKTSSFSPREVEQYHYNKGTIIVRLIEFATTILKCDQDVWKVPHMLYNMHHFESFMHSFLILFNSSH